MPSLASVGEVGLIARWTKGLSYDNTVYVGVGDDAAVLCGGKDWRLLVTTDMLVDGVHFVGRVTPPQLIGRKALAVSLSDIAAMGGVPWAAIVAAGIPRGYSVHALDALYRGLRQLARQFNVQLIGGDTVRAKVLTLTVTLTGWVEPGNVVLRRGARVGDDVWVTGRLGGAVRTGRHLRFTPRVAAARHLVARYHPTAMMDLSDGLASDLRQLARASRVGFRIDAMHLPRAVGARVGNALCDGEDFELVWTLAPSAGRRLARAQDLGVRATRIGMVTRAREGLVLVERSGRQRPLPAPRFRHF